MEEYEIQKKRGEIYASMDQKRNKQGLCVVGDDDCEACQ